MAFLSLHWLHEDNSYLDMYDTSPQEDTYNDCIRVGDIVLYYIQQRHSKPPDQAPFVWFKQFTYAISLGTTFKQYTEPSLMGDKIRSIYVQSFPHHYRRDLIKTGTFPHSPDHMQDIAIMTEHFANIYNQELTQPGPIITPSGAHPLRLELDIPLQHNPCFAFSKKDLTDSDPGGVELIHTNNLPNFGSFQPSSTDFSSNETLHLHLQWMELPPFSKPPLATLYCHVAEYLMHKMDFLHWEDDLLRRWTHRTLGPTDHRHLCILHWTIQQWLPISPTPHNLLESTSPAQGMELNHLITTARFHWECRQEIYHARCQQA